MLHSTRIAVCLFVCLAAAAAKADVYWADALPFDGTTIDSFTFQVSEWKNNVGNGPVISTTSGIEYKVDGTGKGSDPWKISFDLSGILNGDNVVNYISYFFGETNTNPNVAAVGITIDGVPYASTLNSSGKFLLNESDSGEYLSFSGVDADLVFYLTLGTGNSPGFDLTIAYGGIRGDDGDGSNATPEPATLLILGIGLAGLAVSRSRLGKNKRRK